MDLAKGTVPDHGEEWTSSDPVKLLGRSPPLFDDFSPDPFPDYGPQ